MLSILYIGISRLKPVSDKMGFDSPTAGEYALLLLFLSLLLTIVAYVVYSGLLAAVEVSALSPPFEPSVFAYKVHLV